MILAQVDKPNGLPLLPALASVLPTVHGRPNDGNVVEGPCKAEVEATLFCLAWLARLQE